MANRDVVGLKTTTLATKAPGSQPLASMTIPNPLANGRYSSEATRPDSIMRDTDNPTPSTAQPHSLHLYPPLLLDEGATNHLGTPYATNRADCPFVSLQLKSKNDQKLPPSNMASTNNTTASRSAPRALTGRHTSSAG